MKTLWVFCAILTLTCVSFTSDLAASPVSIVPAGSVWKYLADGTDPGTAWRDTAFDDSIWPSGLAQLGFGDGDEATMLTPGMVTAYFRRAFESQFSGVTSLTLRLLRDDGAVVYLNGVEVFRNNMPAGPVTYNTFATTSVGGAEETTQFITAALDPNMLVQGVNVIAVEVHQVALTSGDLSFDLELIAEAGPTLPTVNVVATDADASESGPLAAIFPGTFTFYRSPMTTNALTVFFTIGGTAENGADYARITNEVRFNSGQAQARVDIFPLEDGLVEGTESVVLTLQEPACIAVIPPPPGCYRVGPSNHAEVLIKDANSTTNQRPYVQLNEPREGQVFTAPTNVVLRAFAYDREDMNHLNVEFFANGNTLGLGTFVPTTCPGPYCPYYQLVWSDPQPDNYTLVARATDSAGASSNSAPVNITVRFGDLATNVTIIAFGSAWKYLDTGTDLGTAWREPAFNDSGWASGRAQLGYGDGDESTPVGFGPDPSNKYVTTYFRRSINVINAASFVQLRGHLLQDDGGAVYLNGVEIFRSNLPAAPITFSTFALSAAENQIVEFSAPTTLLREGLNVVAVEIHQNAVASSDLSFDLELASTGAFPPPELPVVTVVATDSDAAESGLLTAIFSGTFTFSRTGSVSDALTAFFTLSGTAGNGADYRYVSNSARFNPGQAQARVEIAPLNDNLIEGIENVVVTLQEPACIAVVPAPPGCYRVGAPNRAEVFIKDATPPQNTPPYVQLNQPQNGSVFMAPTNILLTAFASDREDGSQLGVEFFANGESLGHGTFVPALCPAPFCPFYQLIWSDAPPGEYTIIARATDSSGASSNSAPATIKVLPATPPAATDDQENPAVATDGVNFLVVWMDRRNGDFEYDIYGARVSASGQVLDTNGIPICTAPTSQWYPAVAFDGHNYLVVWSDGRDGKLDIYGARVSLTGTVLDPAGIQITHGEVAYQPTVAFNGTDYLVGSYAWEHAGVRETTLLGVRVTPAGVARDMEELVLHQATGPEYPAVVASIGDDWLVAWNRGGVEAVRVSSSGDVSEPLTLLTEGSLWVNGLVGGTDNYFLTTMVNRRLTEDTLVQDIYGTWISPDGHAIRTILIAGNTNQSIGRLLQPTTFKQEHPTVAFNGAELFVVWDAGDMYYNGGNAMYLSDIRGARVDASGTVSPVISVCDAPQNQSSPAIAFNGQRFLAVWQDARTAPPLEYYPARFFDIYGARIGPEGSVMEHNGFLISGMQPNRPPQVHFNEPHPGAVFDAPANITLAAYAQDPEDGFNVTVEFFAGDRSLGFGTFVPTRCATCPYFSLTWSNVPVGTYTVRARATDQAGASTVSEPVVVTVRSSGPESAPRDQQMPAIAANNELYFVVWVDQREFNDTEWDVYGARVTPEGRVLDPNGIRICVQPGIQWYPSVASDGRDFFVVWHDGRAQNGTGFTDIYGARVTADGVVLDPDGFLISNAGWDQFGPSVAFNGTEYLAAWYDYRNSTDSHLVTDIYGARISRDGVVLDPQGIAICAADDMQWAPGVAALGDNFFAGWGDSRGQVRGTLVSGAGTVTHPDGLVLGPYFSGYFIKIAANASGFLTVWTDPRNYDTTQYDIFARRTDAAGELIGGTDFVLCNISNMQTAPAVAAANDQFLAVWIDSRSDTFNPGIFGARIGTNGVLERNGFLISDQAYAYGLTGPAAANLNRQYLVAWVQGNNDTYGPTDIVAARVDTGGSVLDAIPFLVSSIAPATVDADRDGVPDVRDQCPNTPAGAVVDAHGCSVAELCPCDGGWSHHSEYVDCVIQNAWKFFRGGSIIADTRRELIRDAVISNCGRGPDQSETACIHLFPLTGEECHREGVQFVISGDAIGPCVLECSTDLVNWTLVPNSTIGVNGIEITCPIEPGTRARFYRVRNN